MKLLTCLDFSVRIFLVTRDRFSVLGFQWTILEKDQDLWPSPSCSTVQFLKFCQNCYRFYLRKIVQTTHENFSDPNFGPPKWLIFTECTIVHTQNFVASSICLTTLHVSLNLSLSAFRYKANSTKEGWKRSTFFPACICRKNTGIALFCSNCSKI